MATRRVAPNWCETGDAPPVQGMSSPMRSLGVRQCPERGTRAKSDSTTTRQRPRPATCGGGRYASARRRCRLPNGRGVCGPGIQPRRVQEARRRAGAAGGRRHALQHPGRLPAPSRHSRSVRFRALPDGDQPCRVRRGQRSRPGRSPARGRRGRGPPGRWSRPREPVPSRRQTTGEMARATPSRTMPRASPRKRGLLRASSPTAPPRPVGPHVQLRGGDVGFGLAPRITRT